MEERRQALRDYYDRMAPEERRRRIILKPEFRDAYNELVEADRQFPVPQYLWEKWVPILGLFPVGVYLELRRMCFVNRATGERRDWCWPRQATLAKRLGVRKRQTVGEALRLLETNGFIKRKSNYRRRGTDGAIERRADLYLVYFEVPLVPDDAADLLVRRTTVDLGDGGMWPEPDVTLEVATATGRMSETRTYGPGPAEEPARTSETRTDTAVRKTDSRNVTRTITSNVHNVGRTEGTEGTCPGNEPGADRTARSALALEIGESLKTWAGEKHGEGHPSEGFHRRVASRMPERLVREALTATRDAVERRRAGQGGCVRGPAAYFAGVAKKLAEGNHIDLGLRKSDETREERPRKRTRLAMALRSPAVGTPSMDDTPMSVEASKAAIKALLETIRSK